MSAIKELLERYLLLWLILLSGIAFFADRVLPVDVFIASKSLLPWLIFATMFAIGWMLPRDEVTQVVQHWPTVFGGTAVQYTTMPLLAYGLARIFQFDHGLVVGIIMVGCVPGAMASNVLTLMAKGNTSYSVSLTTTATLLSPVVVPIALSLTLGESVDRMKFLEASFQLGWTVVLPVIGGHLLSRLVGHTEGASVVGAIVANLTILWIIAYVVAANRARLSEIQLTLLSALLILNLLGYAAGNLAGRAMRLPTAMQRALTLEVGMQNAGLGTALVTSLFADPAIAIPPALYTFGCMLTGTVLARVWNSVPANQQVP